MILKTAIAAAAFLVMLSITVRAESLDDSIDDLSRATLEQHQLIELLKQQQSEDMERQRARNEEEMSNERARSFYDLDPYTQRPHYRP
jgi:hypothetical protein